MGKRVVVLCSISQRFTGHEQIPLNVQAIGINCIRGYCIANPVIRKHFDIRTEYFDIFTSAREIARVLELQSPSIIGFSCFSVNFEKTLSIAYTIRRRMPEVTIIIGGPQVIYAADQLEQYPFVDMAMKGEGELTFREYLLSLVGKKEIAKIPGIAFRENGKIVFTGNRKKWINLAEIPSIYTDEILDEISGTILLETSRGCSYKCAYCDTANQKYREFPIDRVKNDLSRILAKTNISGILFTDPNLAHNNERFEEILEFLVQNNTNNISIDGFWSSLPQISQFFEKMKRAGFKKNIRVCVQSTSTKVLKLSRRTWLAIPHLTKVAPELHEYFPEARIELILGLPGETPTSFRNCMSDLFKLGFRQFTINPFMLLQGTEFYNRRKELGLECADNISNIVASTPDFTSQELYHARRFRMKFQQLALLIQPDDICLLESKGINIIEMAENFEWLESVFSISDSIDIANPDKETRHISMDILEPLAEFLERYYKLKRNESKIIVEYIRVKYMMSQIEKQSQDSLKERTENSLFPLIHAYEEIETINSVPQMMGIKYHDNKADLQDNAIIFAVFSLRKRKVVPVMVENVAFFRQLLKVLVGAKSKSGIINAFDPAQKTMVLKSIVSGMVSLIRSRILCTVSFRLIFSG